MQDDSQIAASGTWGIVVWAGVSPGSISQARKFFLELDERDRAKSFKLFQWLAEFGTIRNPEKFKPLGEHYGPAGRDLFEFKSFQIRFLGDFRPQCRFIIALGMRKKKDRHDKSDLEAARTILTAYDALNSVKENAR